MDTQKRKQKVKKSAVKQTKKKTVRRSPVTATKAKMPIGPKQKIPAGSVASNEISSVKITVNIDVEAFQLPYIAFYSYLVETGVVQQLATSGTVNAYQFIGDAVSFMYAEGQKMVKGGPATPATVPVVFRDLMAALTPKSVPTPFGSSIKFGWGEPVFNNMTPYTVGGYQWQVMQPLVDTTLYDSKVAVIPTNSPSEDNYNTMITTITSRGGPRLSLVPNTVADSVLKNSVSAFARAYVYNGLQPNAQSAAGYYKDVELEVPITDPNLAQFAYYGQDDRVPLYLGITTGDASSTFALPLDPTYRYNNKGRAIYKNLDFETICDTLCAWAAKCKEAMVANVDVGYNSNPYSIPFAFSYQDFRVMLRQALMAFFRTAYFTQFTGPYDTASGNYFMPFYTMGGTWGNPKFLSMLLPELIAENLNALKMRSIVIGNRNYIYVPVLGRYLEDTPAEWTYVLTEIPTGGVNLPVITTVNLFSVLPQTAINLINGESSGNYINLNGQYYMNIMNDWNSFVNAASKVSTAIKGLSGDMGAKGLLALSATKIVDAVQATTKQCVDLVTLRCPQPLLTKENSKKAIPPLPPRQLEAHKRVKNFQRSAKNELGTVPPATSSELSLVSVTSATFHTEEEAAFYQNIILPTIRLSITGGGNLLTFPKYQMEVMETFSLQYNPEGGSVVGGSVSSELQLAMTLAGWCIQGGAGQVNSYARMMAMLTDTGHAGFLSGILGGLAKSILPPEMHGIIDTVSDLVPI